MINCQNWLVHSKVTSLPKTLQPLKKIGGALGLSMTDSHEKMTFFNDAFWKVLFTPKVGVLIALNSKRY
jgi:hypothetical protein